MIEKVTVLDANYSGLEECFPKNAEFDVNSGLVLLVGPNGSGKTAFLRMLATSIDYEQFFREEGISKSWTTPDPFAISHSSIAGCALRRDTVVEEIKSGWYHTRNGREFVKLLINDPRFNLDLKDIREIKKRGEKVICISGNALEQLKNVHGILSEETDLNVWRYLKPVITGGQVFYQEVTANVRFETYTPWAEGKVRYVTFVPTYDGRIENPRLIGQNKTPGQSLALKVDDAFGEISNFFENRTNPVWEKGVLRGMEYDRSEAVPEDSQLIVFMDEPTSFFDYVNKYRFKDRVMQVLERHSPNLQIFIATNDPILIEKTEGCKYINLYKHPAEAASELVLPL